MIRLIFKQIWNQRKQNGWIFIELMIASFFLWAVVDPVYVLYSNIQIPLGYVEEDSYVITMGMYPSTHRKYSEAYDNDSLKKIDFVKIYERIKVISEVESSVIMGFNCHPNSYSYYGTTIFRDSLKMGAQEYRFSTISGGDLLSVMQLRNAYTGELISLDSAVYNGKSVYITKNIADKLFKDEYAIGKEVMFRDSTKLNIVGVIENIKNRTDKQPNPILICVSPEMYSISNRVSPIVYIRTKTGINQKAFEERFRKEVAPTLQIGNFYFSKISSMKNIRKKYAIESGIDNTFRYKLALAGFALLCIFLGMVGTFWIRSNARRQEIGLMKAMGCSTVQIIKQFFVESWLLLTLAFIPAMIAQLHIIHEMGFYLSDYNPNMNYLHNRPVPHFLIVTVVIYLILLITVLIGTYIPVRKAAHAIPAEALRDE